MKTNEPISELITANEIEAQVCQQRVETPPAELSRDPKNQHVMTFSRTEMCLASDADARADVFEVGKTNAADAVEAVTATLTRSSATAKSTARPSYLVGVL